MLLKFFTGVLGAWSYNLIATGKHFPAISSESDAQNILLVLNHADQPVLTQYR
jgi:hypothetical protein